MTHHLCPLYPTLVHRESGATITFKPYEETIQIITEYKHGAWGNEVVPVAKGRSIYAAWRALGAYRCGVEQVPLKDGSDCISHYKVEADGKVSISYIRSIYDHDNGFLKSLTPVGYERCGFEVLPRDEDLSSDESNERVYFRPDGSQEAQPEEQPDCPCCCEDAGR